MGNSGSSSRFIDATPPGRRAGKKCQEGESSNEQTLVRIYECFAHIKSDEESLGL
jgi:hypothetical protein